MSIKFWILEDKSANDWTIINIIILFLKCWILKQQYMTEGVIKLKAKS